MSPPDVSGYASPDTVRPDDASLAPIGDPRWHERERLTGSWWGGRTWLSDRGVAFDASLTFDFTKNLRGGVDTAGTSLLHLYDVYLTLDTERLLQWKGGTFFVVFQHQTGQSPDDEVRSFQGVSTIDADGRTQVSEAYFEQRLLDDRLILKLGKIDANADFACSDVAAPFIGASMASSPNNPMPTYPDAGFGASARLFVVEDCYIAAGIFDGAAQEGVPTGSRGPKTLFGEPSDLYVTLEGGYQRKGTRIGVGAWHHTGTFDRLDGDGTERGTSGCYVTVDHALYAEASNDPGDTQGLSFFAIYSYANPAVIEAAHHLAAGCVYEGLVPTRDEDLIGLGASWVSFANDAGFASDGELAIELFYQFRPWPFVSVQPDLQYFIDAGGDRDALAATLRVQIDL